eukprot:3403714-Rhodomonas_salina.4
MMSDRSRLLCSCRSISSCFATRCTASWSSHTSAVKPLAFRSSTRRDGLSASGEYLTIAIFEGSDTTASSTPGEPRKILVTRLEHPPQRIPCTLIRTSCVPESRTASAPPPLIERLLDGWRSFVKSTFDTRGSALALEKPRPYPSGESVLTEPWNGSVPFLEAKGRLLNSMGTLVFRSVREKDTLLSTKQAGRIEFGKLATGINGHTISPSEHAYFDRTLFRSMAVALKLQN